MGIKSYGAQQSFLFRVSPDVNHAELLNGMSGEEFASKLIQMVGRIQVLDHGTEVSNIFLTIMMLAGVPNLLVSLGHPGRRRIVLGHTSNTMRHVITHTQSHNVLSKFTILW